MNAMYLILNAVVFQITWFVCILFAGSLWLGLAVVLLAIQLFISWLYFSDSFDLKGEIKLLLVCAALGAIVESVIIHLNIWSTYNSDVVAPLWLIGIWAGFATTLNMSLGFLKGKALLSAIFGAAFAPLSYYGGSLLSPNYSILDPAYSLPIIAIIWFFVMPLLVAISSHRFFNPQRSLVSV